MQFGNLILRPAGRQSASNSENCEKRTTPNSPPCFPPSTRTQAPAVAGHPAVSNFTPYLVNNKNSPRHFTKKGRGL